MLDIGYALSNRFPDPPQTDYRRADVHALRHDLFCGDVYLADTKEDRELSTAWGWVPVLDFAWALCDIAERLDRGPAGSRASRPQHAELDFTESTDRMLFERRFGWVDIEADWMPVEEPRSPSPTRTCAARPATSCTTSSPTWSTSTTTWARTRRSGRSRHGSRG